MKTKCTKSTSMKGNLASNTVHKFKTEQLLELLSRQSDLVTMVVDHLIVLVLLESVLARKDIYLSDK